MSNYIRKVALLIGNDDYIHISKLKNAINDVKYISPLLETAGYEVDSLYNLTYNSFTRALKRFENQICEGCVGIFWYAGHGIQHNGNNFLIPTDKGDFYTASDIIGDCISIDIFLKRIGKVDNKTVIVFIDACRTNYVLPENTRDFSTPSGLYLGHRDVPYGIHITYSAGSNEIALDKLGPLDTANNSLFAREIVPQIMTPGLDIDQACKNARKKIRKLAKDAGYEQNPAYYNQLTEDFCVIELHNKNYEQVATDKNSSIIFENYGSILCGFNYSKEIPESLSANSISYAVTSNEENHQEINLEITQESNESSQENSIDKVIPQRIIDMETICGKPDYVHPLNKEKIL